MDELSRLSASEIADRIRRRKLSSVEIVEACLQRIDETNPQLNAVVTLTADSALECAKAADKALHQDVHVGPLHGVPFTVKDNLPTEGVRTTSATQGLAHTIPQEDAIIVHRMKAAGGIMLGKTNLPELAFALETNNRLFGRTNNPYDLSRTPGGSSGGEAAIIAVGGSPVGLGNDAWGSIRQPAHCCGIVGIKPTRGRVPNPTAGSHWARMIQMGPMARYIDDLILVLPVLSGPDWHDPACVPVPLRSPGDVDLSSLRIAVYTENGIAQPTTTTVETVLETATMLRRAGAEVNEEQPPGVDLTLQMGIKAIGRDWLEDALEHTGTQAEERHELLNEFLEILASQDLTALEYKLFLAEWNAFQSSMHRFMTKYDIVLCPVSGEAAMRHGTTWANYEQMSYPTAYNLSGLPAVSVRAGTSPEGLPINVQVVAGPWREDAALAVARHIETELGGWSPPALLNA